MAGVKAYAKLGTRLVGLNALKSGIQSNSRKTARLLNNIGITPQYLRTGFTAVASVAALWLWWKSWFPSIVYVAFGFALYKSLVSAQQKSARRPRNRSTDETCSTAVFLGSGDIMSLNKATAFENGLKSSNVTANQTERSKDGPFQFVELPRARKVGQSYVSSIGTTLHSLVITFWKLAARPILTTQNQQIPDLLIVNGPGTCVMVVLVYKLLRILGQHSPEIIYVESFARVTSLSLSGKILKNLVDKFVVQWPIANDSVGGTGRTDGDGAVSMVGKNRESLSGVEYYGWLI
ncbi:hypothetical protein QFC21_002662 [Naganishia friedmannii]|uniref:Uncharacterized protein n=1 Tax=Naganishia friedmannii TaxID=89922 RepID=A0ACC2VUX3_9TREE|nr:hypothetical protein QFC21_002662 [Naganishia friedmannii]